MLPTKLLKFAAVNDNDLSCDRRFGDRNFYVNFYVKKEAIA